MVGWCRQIGVLCPGWLPLRMVDRPMRLARWSSKKIKNNFIQRNRPRFSTNFHPRRNLFVHWKWIILLVLICFGYPNFLVVLFVRLGWKGVPDDHVQPNPVDWSRVNDGVGRSILASDLIIKFFFSFSGIISSPKVVLRRLVQQLGGKDEKIT